MRAHLSGYQMQMGGLGGLMVAGMGGALLAVESTWVKAAFSEEQAQTRLRAAINATGGAISQAHLERLAEDLSKITPYAIKDIESVMGLGVAMGLTEPQVTKLTPVVADLAAVMRKNGMEGASMEQAMRLVTRSIESDTPAMARFGIVIDKDAWAAATFDERLKMVADHCRGAAKEFGDSAEGGMQKFRNELEHTEAVAGKALIPALSGLMKAADPLLKAFKWIAETPLGPVLITTATGAVVLSTAIGALAPLLGAARGAWGWLAARMGFATTTAMGVPAAQAAAGAAALAAGGQAGSAALGWNALAAAQGRTMIAPGAIGAGAQAAGGAAQQVGGAAVGGGILARAGAALGRGVGAVGRVVGSPIGRTAIGAASLFAIGYEADRIVTGKVAKYVDESAIPELEKLSSYEDQGNPYTKRKTDLYRALLTGEKQLDQLTPEEGVIYYGVATPGARNAPGMRGGAYHGFSPEMQAAVSRATMARAQGFAVSPEAAQAAAVSGDWTAGMPAELTTAPAQPAATGLAATPATPVGDLAPGLIPFTAGGSERFSAGRGAGKSAGNVSVDTMAEAPNGDVTIGIRVSQDDLPEGDLDDSTTDYLADLSYAGAY